MQAVNRDKESELSDLTVGGGCVTHHPIRSVELLRSMSSVVQTENRAKA